MSDDSRTSQHITNTEDHLTPEELISQMHPDELQELLGEMGLESTQEMAACIQRLVKQLGSLEAAIDALEDETPASRAA